MSRIDLLSDVRIELAEVPLSGGSDFNAVGPDSVSEFPHEVAKRNGPLLLGLFQSGAGVFEVDSVHFLPGQALQEAEVIHRNDSGHVFPTAGDNGPLLPVGGAVYNFGKLFPRFRDIKACHGDVPFVQFVRVNDQYGAGGAGIARGAPVWTANRHKYGAFRSSGLASFRCTPGTWPACAGGLRVTRKKCCSGIRASAVFDMDAQL